MRTYSAVEGAYVYRGQEADPHSAGEGERGRAALLEIVARRPVPGRSVDAAGDGEKDNTTAISV